MPRETDEGFVPYGSSPSPSPTPTRRTGGIPLQIGGLTASPTQTFTAQPQQQPQQPTTAPAFTMPVRRKPETSGDLFPSQATPVQPPPSLTQVTPPGFMQGPPQADMHAMNALAGLPANWQTLLQSLGFFTGPASGTGDLPARLRQRGDPLARLR